VFHRIELAEAVFARPMTRQITARRLLVLTRNLPLESNTARKLGAHKPGDWDLEAELTARVVDELSIANYLYVKSHVRKGTVVREPKPIPRPSSVTGEDRKRPATAEELARFIGRGKGRGIVRYAPKGG
jgi:hypothetical protein